MTKTPQTVELIDVTQRAADIALARVAPMIRHACLYSQNVLTDIALSCYLQGAVDVVGEVPVNGK